MENSQSLSNSFWLTNLANRNFQSTPTLPVDSEVVVIGGGISGVSTAYWLNRLGVEVTLLERGGLAEGATGRNGGHLTYGTNKDFSEAVSTHGLNETLTIWHFTEKVIELIQEFIHQHQVDCDLHFSSLASLALTQAEAEQHQEAFDQMRAAGLDVEFWDAGQCAERTHSSSFFGGFLYRKHAQVWAAKLVLAIADVAMQSGVNIQTQTVVQDVEQATDYLIVRTPRGDIQAKYVVHATNAYARHLRPVLKDLIIPVRGQVIITQTVPHLWDFGWLTNQGYEYCLQRPDGRIVLGGMRRRAPNEDRNVEDDRYLEPVVSQGLREFLPHHFEALRDVQIQQEWTGIMGFTRDDNPLVGELPSYPGEYIIAGYTGHGMSIAFGAGKAIAEMIVGEETDLPTAFSSTRLLG